MPVFGAEMVFTLRLRPIRGYDFEKTRDLLVKTELCSHAPDQQPQSASSIPLGEEGTVQFWKESVSVYVRAENPASLIRFVYVAAWAGHGITSGVSPSFEVTKYDFMGTPPRPTVNAVFRAFVDGEVAEAARIWGEEKARMFRAFLAVRDLEERIRAAGPEGVPRLREEIEADPFPAGEEDG